MVKTIQPTEQQEQTCVVNWFRMQYPQELIFNIPNGVYIKSHSVRGMMKKSGLTSGVPDLCVAVANRHYNGLYIEMKRRKGGVVSQEQKDIIEHLNTRGYKAVVCKGADEAIKVITQYMGDR